MDEDSERIAEQRWAGIIAIFVLKLQQLKVCLEPISAGEALAIGGDTGTPENFSGC